MSVSMSPAPGAAPRRGTTSGTPVLGRGRTSSGCRYTRLGRPSSKVPAGTLLATAGATATALAGAAVVFAVRRRTTES
ncbi:hypothetical protein [Streptomyces sp. NPDC013457]|uniref:hypothetical protein n=1 Tax=Streptomyces sp. NPDC013457 TaxID=3364866 RepID=UPI0036FDD547